MLPHDERLLTCSSAVPPTPSEHFSGEDSVAAPRKAMQLVQDKISLPPAGGLIFRGRLISRMRESIEACTATVITGRAGTGKTSLALSFANRSGRRVAWFKVEAGDSDQRVFFDYLITSISKHRPGFKHGQLKRVVETATIEDMPLVAETLLFDLLETNGEPLLIVFDDLHQVYDAEWVVPFFGRLLPLLPPEVHVVITCRSLLPTPLWRMRSKQSLCVIDEDSLAFTLDEACVLFREHRLPSIGANEALAISRGKAALLSSLVLHLAAPADAAT